jgi:hypothetical protein
LSPADSFFLAIQTPSDFRSIHIIHHCRNPSLGHHETVVCRERYARLAAAAHYTHVRTERVFL